MKRTLVLLRHGEAEPLRSFDMQDRARALTEKGYGDITRLAQSSLKQLITPQTQFLVSPAVRTRMTFEILTQGLGLAAPKLTWCPAFYDGSQQQILDAFHKVDDASTHVVAIGHNPTWSDFVSQWSGTHTHLAPGNAAVFHTETLSWSQCALGQAAWQFEAIVAG